MPLDDKLFDYLSRVSPQAHANSRPERPVSEMVKVRAFRMSGFQASTPNTLRTSIYRKSISALEPDICKYELTARVAILTGHWQDTKENLGLKLGKRKRERYANARAKQKEAMFVGDLSQSTQFANSCPF